jgi:hypothetical protein
MTRHELLDNVRHKDLRIERTFAPNRGLDRHVARVFPVELGALQAEYPLFFTRNPSTGQFDIIALLGFHETENLYLGAGDWLARRIPMSIERGPFLIGFQEQTDNGVPVRHPVIHVDMDHPWISESQGEPVFLPHGGESPLLERINTLLATIHAGHEASASFTRMLEGLELIESLDLEVEFNDGSKHALQGLYTIHEERLAGLDSDSLGRLHETGALRDIYMMLASLPNLGVLIERRNRIIATEQEGG